MSACLDVGDSGKKAIELSIAKNPYFQNKALEVAKQNTLLIGKI